MSGHKGWIGVDLDGTLAHYDHWRGELHIGSPIAPMLARIKAWLAAGHKVKLFTARWAQEEARSEFVRTWARWCHENGIVPPLEITNVKDFQMIELWDDRAIQVVPNTGERADGDS